MDLPTPIHLSLKDLPCPPEHWLTGSMGAFAPDQFHLYLLTLRKNLGPIFKIRFFQKPVVIISDPESVQWMLKNRPDKFRRVSHMEKVFKEIGIHGAFSAEGDEWVRHRKLLNPAFKPSQLRHFYPTLHRISERLCKVLDSQQEPFDFQAFVQRYTVDVTTTLAFGCDLNTLENPMSELQKSLSCVFPILNSRLKAPFAYWRFFKLKRDRELDRAIVTIRKAVAQFVDSAKQRLAENGHAQNILEAMLNEANIQQDDVFGNVITLLLAGEDTTANTLAWAIHYLADLPELQDQIWQEISDNYPQNGRLTWDDLDRCPLVFGVIQESLRLKPVAPFLYIEPLADEMIRSYLIPKGTMITALLSSNHLSEGLFNEPLEFNPRRWAVITESEKKNYAAELFPFGIGPRLCPGMQLAFAEMKLALIEMLYLFKFFRPENTARATESFEFTVKPKNLIVQCVKRKKEHAQTLSATECTDKKIPA